MIVATNAISIPEPAIWPSSDRPRKAVGRNEKKPAVVPAAANAKGIPAFFAAVLRASCKLSIS
jgi:hypothetical protein